jgi:hypothetical protein
MVAMERIKTWWVAVGLVIIFFLRFGLSLTPNYDINNHIAWMELAESAGLLSGAWNARYRNFLPLPSIIFSWVKTLYYHSQQTAISIPPCTNYRH